MRAGTSISPRVLQGYWCVSRPATETADKFDVMILTTAAASQASRAAVSVSHGPGGVQPNCVASSSSSVF